MIATKAQSRASSATGGSSAQWHNSDSTPDTRPNKPIAAVGKARTRRVSSE